MIHQQIKENTHCHTTRTLSQATEYGVLKRENHIGGEISCLWSAVLICVFMQNQNEYTKYDMFYYNYRISITYFT